MGVRVKMKTELIGTIFLSEKRKTILLMLMNGPLSIDDIKNALPGNSSAIMTQVKILQEQSIIALDGDKYHLTDIGTILVKKMCPMLDTVNVLEKHIKYWETRDLSAIPNDLLERIGELGDTKLIEPDLNHLFEPPKELIESLEKASEVCTIYSYFCPICPKNYSYLARKGTNFTLVLARSVFERLRDEFQTEYNEMMNSQRSNIFICNDEDVKLGALSVTDDLLLLAFFNKEGMFDHRKLISFDERAHHWGMELFEYYKSISKKVK